nr:LCP family protein [Corynebacterium nuruki]
MLSPMPQTPDGPDNFARDHEGRPILDRYGRLVPSRGSRQSPPAPQQNSQDRTRMYGDRGDRGGRDGRANGAGQPQPPQYRRAGQQPGQPYQEQRYPAQQRPQGPPAGPPQNPSRPGNGRPRRPPRPPRRRRFRPMRVLGALIVVILLVAAGSAWWVDSKLQRVDALANYDGRPGNTKGTNWLLVGSDSREGMSEEEGERYSAGDLSEGGSRTDSIIVVHVPGPGAKPTMVSIPRDSYVDVPGYGMDKINASFSYGGPQLLQQTIEQNTGMRIDHYMEIGFGGFGSIVDAVGGVTLCPKEPIDDPMAGINIPAGCQKMDGPTALGYVRTRYTSANGDLDRVERQREFLTAVVKKVGSFGTIVNPFKAFPLMGAFTDAITVDRHDRVWHLGSLALGLVRGADQQTVPVGGYEDTDAGNVILWDEQGAEDLFRKMR